MSEFTSFKNYLNVQNFFLRFAKDLKINFKGLLDDKKANLQCKNIQNKQNKKNK